MNRRARLAELEERYGSRTIRTPLPNEPHVASFILAGWVDLLDDVIEQLDQVVPSWQVVQVKEKFGRLRLAVRLPDTAAGADVGADVAVDLRARQIVEDAEAASATICDICGAVGRMRHRHHWFITRCDEHADDQPIEGHLTWRPEKEAEET